MTTIDYHTENASKRRKFDYTDDGVESMECSPVPDHGWNLLQPILENDVLCAKIPTSNVAFDLLAKWFQIIAGDQEKLRVFRQWIMTRFVSKERSGGRSLLVFWKDSAFVVI
jgi:hypothetical protein